jgi:hypothetical protein
MNQFPYQIDRESVPGKQQLWEVLHWQLKVNLNETRYRRCLHFNDYHSFSQVARILTSLIHESLDTTLSLTPAESKGRPMRKNHTEKRVISSI